MAPPQRGQLQAAEVVGRSAGGGTIVRARHHRGEAYLPNGLNINGTSKNGLFSRDMLRTRKPAMPGAAYEAELEKLLLELTRINRQIRSRS